MFSEKHLWKLLKFVMRLHFIISKEHQSFRFKPHNLTVIFKPIYLIQLDGLLYVRDTLHT